MVYIWTRSLASLKVLMDFMVCCVRLWNLLVIYLLVDILLSELESSH